jgi:hypothetical protein
MKASELIYRLAKAIESHGDWDVEIAIEDEDGMLHDGIDIRCLDIHEDYFEVYGEELLNVTKR